MTTKKIVLAQPEKLAFPVHIMGKAEIEQTFLANLNTALSQVTAPQLYLALKQIEYAVEVGLNNLKPVAVEAFRAVADGKKSADIGGHRVEVKDLFDYNYGDEYNERKEKQKAELAVLKAQAEAAEIVVKTPRTTTIAVTLKP